MAHKVEVIDNGEDSFADIMIAQLEKIVAEKKGKEAKGFVALSKGETEDGDEG